jgi:ribonuclease R
MGDKVFIRVVSANLEKRQLDYEWVMDSGEEEEVKSEKSKVKNKKEIKAWVSLLSVATLWYKIRG